MKQSTGYLELSNGCFHDVKLIIGNGFDLACGLKSSYKDFFEASEPIYKEIRGWIASQQELPQEATAWDIMFVALKEKDSLFADLSNIHWCNIEASMKIVLGLGEEQNIPFSFERVSNAFGDAKVALSPEEEKVFHYAKDQGVANRAFFYRWLMKELLRFESRFSIYIEKQTQNPEYQKKAEDLLLNRLGLRQDENQKSKKLRSIDTFNYTTPDIFLKLQEERKVSIRHVNGQIGHAIFGIDSNNISQNDPRYAFTKASRKMLLLANGKREDHNRDYKSVAIFGHSLSEADYSYLFPILDNLNLYNQNVRQSRLIYAFAPYCAEASSLAANSLTGLLLAYEKWKTAGKENGRIVEIAMTCDRIGFKEIDTSDLGQQK